MGNAIRRRNLPWPRYPEKFLIRKSEKSLDEVFMRGGREGVFSLGMERFLNAPEDFLSGQAFTAECAQCLRVIAFC
jgi:hypothetical protein